MKKPAKSTSTKKVKKQPDFLAQVAATALLADSGSDLDYRTTLETLAYLITPHMADWCTIDVVNEKGETERIATAHIDPTKRELARTLEKEYPPRSDAPGGAAYVIRTGESQLVPVIPDQLLRDSMHDERHYQLCLDLGLKSYVCVPITAGEKVLGAISMIYALSGRTYGSEELTLAQALAHKAGQVIVNSRRSKRERQELEERTQSEQILRQVNEQFHSILDSMTDAFFALDHDWRFRYVNRQAEVLLERPASEMVGQNIWELFPDAVGTEFHKRYEDAVKRQQAVVFEEFYPPLGRWFQVQAVPYVNGLSVYFHDVSEIKSTTLALQESEERFRAAVEAIGDIIWTNNADGEMQSEQPQWGAYTGQTFEEYRGYGWAEAVHPEDAPGTVETWQRAVNGKQMFLYEHRVRGQDGIYRLYSVRAVPVLQANGDIREWVGIHTDITDRKQRQEERSQLLERERMSRQQNERERERAASLSAQVESLREELVRTREELSTFQDDLENTTRELKSQQERQVAITLSLRAVNRAGARLLFITDMKTVLETILEALTTGFNVSMAGIWIAEGKAKKLRLLSSAGLDDSYDRTLPEEIDIAYDASKLGWVARLRRPFVSSSLQDDLQFDQKWLSREGLVAAGLFPLVVQDQLLGLMALFSKKPLPLEAGEVLSTLSALLSASLDNLRRTDTNVQTTSRESPPE